MWRLIPAIILAALGAHAQEPVAERENDCAPPEDAVAACDTSADCAANAYATVCLANGRCAIPCETARGVKDATACSLGETCVKRARAEINDDRRKVWYCEPGPFRVDLNVLDQCINTFIEGPRPAGGLRNDCALEANLARLLEQDGVPGFSIFDLDLCVLAFLEQPGCKRRRGEWICDAEWLVGCGDDADCGRGLYCAAETHSCQRDCGVVGPRETRLTSLERPCARPLTVCNSERGRCEPVDLEGTVCQVDADCGVVGAYCFLGECAPHCGRSLECPSGDWFCALDGNCRIRPHPQANASFEFHPQNYSVQFTRDELRLDPVQTTEQVGITIIDLVTRAQVIDNPAIGFGYRLELTDWVNADARCRALVDCRDPDARPEGESRAECNQRRRDCVINADEEWVRLVSPFGTVNAYGRSAISIALNDEAASLLPAGHYTARLNAYFDNGSSDSVLVSFRKPSVSGEYTGSLVVHMQGEQNHLNGARPLQFGMRLRVTDDVVPWNREDDGPCLGIGRDREMGDVRPRCGLVEANNLDIDEDLIDVTRGRLVSGQLHGQSALAFSKVPVRGEPYVDEIDFVGIHAEEFGFMRLIGIVELPADLCVGLEGGCDGDGLSVTNPFQRTIRRQIEFIGPFDAATGRFSGFYREKISGLVPTGDVTMEGDFVMDQLFMDQAPLELAGPLLPAGARAVGFPDGQSVLDDLDAAIDAACDRGDADDPRDAAWAARRFRSADAFADYLAEARRSGPATDDSVIGRTTIFPQLRQFSEAVEQGLSVLGDDRRAQANHLNIYDFLSNRLLPCDPEDPAPPAICLDEDAAVCGLLLHQKAMLEGWIDLDTPEREAEQPLFCSDTIALDGCPPRADDNPSLFALQEHNRFWGDLTRIRKFAADRARSDAFLVLFRNEIDPFVQGTAISYKADRLREAMRSYDAALEHIISPAAARVLFSWPARGFEQRGNDWLAIMQRVAADRMGALTDLVDLERRVLINSDGADRAFAHQLMQAEYLVQVYLMALQARWQGPDFAWTGAAGPLFEQGQGILNRFDPGRNDVGLQRDHVFFENSNPHRTNWANYYDQLVGEDGDGGIIAAVRASVSDAVDELQAALADLDTLEERLQESRFELEDTLDALCGDPAVDVDRYCDDQLEAFDIEEWERLRNCVRKGGGDDCPDDLTFRCDDADDDCEDVVATFIRETDGGGTYGSYCVLPENDEARFVQIGEQLRPCVGGEMGTALQEKAAIDLERRIVLRKLTWLMQRMEHAAETYDTLRGIDESEHTADTAFRSAMFVIDLVAGAINGFTEVALELADAPDCLVIAGFAYGTNCPQKAGSKISRTAFLAIRQIALLVQNTIRDALEITQAQLEFDFEQERAEAEHLAEMFELIGEVGDLSDEYITLTQASFNQHLAIDDLRYLAQRAADRHADQMTFVAEHLVGRESGNVLVGDQLVREASADFQAALQVAYKMTVAFIHNYNLPPGDAKTLTDRVLAAATVDDLADAAADLDQRHRTACGRDAIDCDATTNVEVLRFSIRDQLFTDLRDRMDPVTNQESTAGEQFHNKITRPPFLKRRARGEHLTDQIEIDLTVPLTLLEATRDGRPQWLINPLACNHLLDPRDPADPGIDRDGNGNGGFGTGTLAVNVILGGVGDHAQRTIRYEIRRGAVDYLRSCTAEPVQREIGELPVLRYPVRKRLIGYSPDSVQGQRAAPRTFTHRSAPFAACINQPEIAGDLDGAGCWRMFARDRSLATLDWRLVLPLRIGAGDTENAWLVGDGLADGERPIIEDIVVYFRHRTRPVKEE